MNLQEATYDDEGHRMSRWMLVVRGVLAALLGLFALVYPSKTIATVVAATGVYFMLDGMFAVITGLIQLVRRNRASLPYFLEGALSVVVGVLALGRPLSFAVGALILIAVRCLGAGLSEIAAGRVFRRETGAAEWPFWIAGGASLVFGVGLLLNPRIGLLSLVWLLGIYGLVFGLGLLTSAFKLAPPLTHHHHAIGR